MTVVMKTVYMSKKRKSKHPKHILYVNVNFLSSKFASIKKLIFYELFFWKDCPPGKKNFNQQTLHVTACQAWVVYHSLLRNVFVT